MNEITTTGMVLSVMPMGEYDRRIELLSADLGRISAFARGARKPGSSLVSVTRAFAFGEFSLYQGKSSYTVRSARIRSYFEELAQDTDSVFYGFYFLELARYFSRENLEAADMLKLLYYGLRALSGTVLDKRLVKAVVDLKMLAINGLCPAPDKLRAPSGVYAFASDMSGGAQKAFQRVFEMPPEKLFTFTLSEAVLEEFSRVVKRLMQMNVDTVFQSEKLLDT